MRINFVPLLSAACLVVLALFVACDAVLFQAHAATTYPRLFMNTAAPSLVPLLATNLSSITRKQWLRAHSEKSVANKGSARSSQRFMNNPGYKPVNHAGTCDASAAVAVGSSMFVVANDEDNILRLYHRDGLVNKPVKSLDLSVFLNLDIQHPEADIEAATRVGDRIYWITSYGANKKGKQRRSRHKFFATRITHAGNEVAIEFVGHPYETLIHDLNFSDLSMVRPEG